MLKKKIAFVVAIPGSAEAFLVNHLERLTQTYDVSLIANFPEDYDASFFKGMKINFINAPIERKISLKNDLKALAVLYNIFKKNKFDSVHSVTPKAGLLTAMAAWLAGVKERIHIYTGQVWATRKGAMRMMLKMMDKMIATLDNHILVDGEGQRQYLIKQGIVKAKNSSVLAHGSICGVKLEKFIISNSVRKNERDKFGFKDDDVVFVFLGRLNHDKGIGELYNAFNRLVPECPKAKLLLYGNDEEGYDKLVPNYANIKKGKNYFYPGCTNTPYDALQSGDVFVLPTWREGFLA
jgi:glycosyltransferase involved in cell wall biosynthesis